MSTIQYTWGFPALDVKYSEGELQKVVTTVHWTLSALEDSHSVSTYGSVGVPEPTPEAFISYKDLTKEEVESWVQSALGQETVDAMFTSLAQQIQNLKTPATGTLTPPWETVTVIEGIV